jgi:hypothetical protein
MAGRETVHFFHERSMLHLSEHGATVAWAMKSIRVAERAAARGVAGNILRPQGE